METQKRWGLTQIARELQTVALLRTRVFVDGCDLEETGAGEPVRSLRTKGTSRKEMAERLPPLEGVDSPLYQCVKKFCKFMESPESCRMCLAAVAAEHFVPASVERCIWLLASIIPVEDLGPEDMRTIEMDQSRESHSFSGFYIMSSRSDVKTSRGEAKERDRRRSDNFAAAVVERAPNLDWREVVCRMDNRDFHIPDAAGLQLIMVALKRGFRNFPFPVDLVYRPWTNALAQLEWFLLALKNPSIFCFADYPSDRTDLAILKSYPEEYYQRELQIWFCVDLVERLLALADVSESSTHQILALTETPLTRCPDGFLLTLLQLEPKDRIVTSKTRQLLVRLCIQKVLVPHPNSQAVLYFAWNVHPDRKMWAQQIMVDAMADWYISGRYDQARLARILNVALDLEALADLVQCDIFSFNIDLACLAAQRGFLELDTWMADRMAEHGVKFVTACLEFLERRCPTLVTGEPLKDEQILPRNAMLPADVVDTILRSLQDALGLSVVTSDTGARIRELTRKSSAVHNRPNPPPSFSKAQPTSPSDLPSPATNPFRMGASEPIGLPVSRSSSMLPTRQLSSPDGEKGLRQSLESSVKMPHPGFNGPTAAVAYQSSKTLPGFTPPHKTQQQASDETHSPPHARSADYSFNKLKKLNQEQLQKFKTNSRRKIASATSRLRNIPTAEAQVVRNYSRHGDGIWDVATPRAPVYPAFGTASADRTACIWNAKSGHCLTQYQGHEGSVNSIRFQPSSTTTGDNVLILTGSGDRSAHIWKVSSSHLAESRESDEERPVESGDNPPPLHTSKSSKMLLNFPLVVFRAHSGVVSCAEWISGVEQVITASWDRSAVLFDVETGESLNTFAGHDDELTYVGVCQPQKLFVTCSKDTTFRLWDLREPNLQSVNVFQGHAEAVNCAVFTPSGDSIVSGGDDKFLRIWDLRNTRTPKTSVRMDAGVNRISISESLLVCIPLDNRNVGLYSLPTAKLSKLPRAKGHGHQRMVTASAWWDTSQPSSPSFSMDIGLFTCGFDRQVFGWKFSLSQIS